MKHGFHGDDDTIGESAATELLEALPARDVSAKLASAPGVPPPLPGTAREQAPAITEIVTTLGASTDAPPPIPDEPGPDGTAPQDPAGAHREVWPVVTEDYADRVETELRPSLRKYSALRPLARGTDTAPSVEGGGRAQPPAHVPHSGLHTDATVLLPALKRRDRGRRPSSPATGEKLSPTGTAVMPELPERE